SRSFRPIPERLLTSNLGKNETSPGSGHALSIASLLLCGCFPRSRHPRTRACAIARCLGSLCRFQLIRRLSRFRPTVFSIKSRLESWFVPSRSARFDFLKRSSESPNPYLESILTVLCCQSLDESTNQRSPTLPCPSLAHYLRCFVRGDESPSFSA